MGRFRVGDIAYIIENNQQVRQVIIIKTGQLYTISFPHSVSGLRVRESRLFATKKDADFALEEINSRIKPASEEPKNIKTHWDY